MSHRSRDTASVTVFDSLMDAMLPFGGAAVALVEAYFDESMGTAKGRRILCVAGYILTDRASRRMSKAWLSTLAEFDLPYFHMVDCAHGNPPFDKLSKAARIAVEMRMIEHIKRRTIKGLAVTVDMDEYETLMPKSPLIGGAYTFCAHVIIGGVLHWIEEQQHTDDVAYFFEAGHSSQSEADGVMQKIFREPELKAAAKYAGHAFVRKEKAPAVQAADLLAWQWYTDIRHRIEGGRRRKDCESLLKHPHQAVHISDGKIMELAQKWTGVKHLIDLGQASLLLGTGRGS